ncbi:MAG: hypothetical protein QM741_07805 [Rudaea sp.]|uniref:hypothetical protein n=1 Tax=Rudaea sp. TaxID=2136325 RepID=UPI0039E3A200
MSRRNVVFAVLPIFFVAGFHSTKALCCDADGIGTTKQQTVAAATVQSAPTPAKQPAPAPGPDVAKAQPAVTAGAAVSNDDAGNNLGDGVAAGTRRRGLRWQSFLPGVIK